MRVFISWSGNSSKAIAAALREWLPLVLQSIDPWMSDEDIDKGQRWRMILDKELRTDVGIICLTPDNVTAPFILFEAGAIAKSVEESYACTYLFNLKPGDIREPLSAFQHTMATKADTKKLIVTLNKATKDRILSDKQIDTIFEKLWPSLEEKLTAIPQTSGEVKPQRTAEEKIDEILLVVRNLQSSQNKTLSDEEKTHAAAKNLLEIAAERNLLNAFANWSGNTSTLTEPTSGGSVQATPRRRYHRKPQALPKGFFPDDKKSK